MSQSVVDLWDRLPEEMRWAKQWCIAGPDKSPYSVNAQGLYRASVVAPEQWLDFETACDTAVAYGLGIGYVICANDALTCIDLDVVDGQTQAAKGVECDPTKWTTPAQFNRYWSIVQHFQSFTEKSRSGKGLHIWVRGKIGKGCRRDGVEVYSQERFIICTGDVIINAPIEPRQELLDILVQDINRGKKFDHNGFAMEELEENESDEVIWERARSAANADKFLMLCEGRWQGVYDSHSEADLALLSMFTFYTKSNDQVRRMFHQTALGQRAKAHQAGYLERTIAGIRAREAREARNVEHGMGVADALLQNMRVPTDDELVAQAIREMENKVQADHLASATVPQPAPANVAMAQLAPLPVVSDKGLAWPPGFTGALAGFIYQSAPRPVKEVAIVAALGLLAGICGKAFGIPQSGLNLYIILVARSAIGKEAMHSGISALMESMRLRCPEAMNFVDFSDFASGPALSKAIAANSSFVNVAGEWGRKLRRLSNEDRLDGPMQQLRTVMTNLYQKSGSSSIVGGITYSNKEQNIASVSGVAYSMIGETTPNTLYESLTESMMEDGFLSRFTIVEYNGERPPHNYSALREPDAALADALAELCNHADVLIKRNQRQEVGRDEVAGQMMTAFDEECDREINSTTDESHRQMWNRAMLKSMRIAALLAVADNYMHPVIQQHHVEWALDVVRRDIKLMQRRMSDGDVGVNDNARERKMLALCKEYITNGVPESYGVPPAMQQAGVIPRKFFQMRVSRLASFTCHRMGSTSAMDSTIRSLIDSGYLMEFPKDKQVELYSYHGKCYRVLNLGTEGKKS